MENLEYKIADPGDVTKDIENKKRQRKYIIIISLLFIVMLLFIVLFIIELTRAQRLSDEKDDLNNKNTNLNNDITILKEENLKLKDEKENLKNQYDVLIRKNEILEYNISANVGSDMLLYALGKRLINISYAEDNVIINSFVKNGNNFIEELGEINNGQNYPKNERNAYDLYIPSSAIEKKDKYNRIILFIHGGAWVGGEKEQLEIFCRIYGSLGFITATMGYTLLANKYEQANIFRIIDEITATIKSIKKELINEGFDGEKLEMAISGGSAGGHLSLLYAYGFGKNSAIPIKFIINLCGPVTLDDFYYIQLKNMNDTLENIDSKSITKAKEEDKVIPISGIISDVPSKAFLVMLLNAFLGRDPREDFDQLYDGENNKVIYSEKYYEIFKKINYSLPVFYIDENSIPTLNVYGGRDNIAGIGHYAYLEDKFVEHKNNNFTLIYSRYAPHLPFEIEHEDGIEKIKEMNYQIFEYSIKYFTKNWIKNFRKI